MTCTAMYGHQSSMCSAHWWTIEAGQTTSILKPGSAISAVLFAATQACTVLPEPISSARIASSAIYSHAAPCCWTFDSVPPTEWIDEPVAFPARSASQPGVALVHQHHLDGLRGPVLAGEDLAQTDEQRECQRHPIEAARPAASMHPGQRIDMIARDVADEQMRVVGGDCCVHVASSSRSSMSAGRSGSKFVHSTSVLTGSVAVCERTKSPSPAAETSRSCRRQPRRR